VSYLSNIRVFVRVVELGNLSAAGRDQRVSPAVASNRIKELERYLGVRLFNRTTRKLTPTEHGRIFYEGALKIIEAVDAAEAAVADLAENPRGTIHVTAPLGIGRRLIGPGVPEFHALYPEVQVRLRLSDRKIDLMNEGVDIAFKLGFIEDSNLRMRAIMDCDRVICASPSYLARRGKPIVPEDLIHGKHHCLLLRFPGSNEFFWYLQTPEGVRKYEIDGPFDTDDGDVLTEWALAGHGIINKPRFEVHRHLLEGRLVPLLEDFPPVAAQLACLYPHRTYQDPKIRLFIDFMAQRCQKHIQGILAAT
jgi:DNA-binding transcriptional LysR family regulator